ncbi:MAG: D-alanyl-D-alanine carboxypeptidase/D-alanyl-D-alanine-endopeptidase [Cyanobacteriota bacterium]|mgnify:CR=1 FL=1
MKKKSLILSLLLLLLYPTISFSKELADVKKINDYIQKNKDLKDASISVIIKDLDTKKVLFDLNSQKLMTPASNIKILTTFLALEKLGKNYTFKTDFATDGYTNEENGNINIKNLYLKMTGDPTFKSSDLKNMISKLKETGLKEIQGDIFIDKSIFDNIIYGPGWMWDDLEDCDDSPISNIYMDDNCLNVSLKLKNNNEFEIKTNNTINIDTSKLEIDEKNDEIINSELKGNKIYFSGKINKKTFFEKENSIKDNDSYLISVLEQLIKENFVFSGKIQTSLEKNDNIISLVNKESEPLYKILKRFNEESHNLTGELLLKTIAFNEDKKIGSTKKGSDILSKHIGRLFNESNFNIVDGSGLSRYNLITPNLIIKVLEYLYQNPNYRDIVYEAFPQGGLEGTLRNRLKKLKNYKVFAKSGSMTGVNCLSGFLVNDKKNTLAFSLMINNTNLKGQELRDIQDKILELIE